MSEADTIAPSTYPAAVREYRSDPDPVGDRDWRWRVGAVNRHILTAGTQGYSRRKDMREAIWSTLEALLIWAMKRDRVRAERMIGWVTARVVEEAG